MLEFTCVSRVFSPRDANLRMEKEARLGQKEKEREREKNKPANELPSEIRRKRSQRSALLLAPRAFTSSLLFSSLCSLTQRAFSPSASVIRIYVIYVYRSDYIGVYTNPIYPRGHTLGRTGRRARVSIDSSARKIRK